MLGEYTLRVLSPVDFLEALMDRAADLRADYDRLGELLRTESGTAAASVARERRLIGEKLEQLEPTKEVPLVDELAAKRADSGSSRPSARRRQSG